ncbi:hypothetical protein NW759_000591 [Fusarium solani]|nr:hypothetical protein NW759_000591 [Fusarium solani]
MSDRSRAATNGNGVSRTRNGTSSSASASVRRNLFQSQLTRRPTAGSSSTSAETLHLDVDVLSDTSEIVVRDKHGEIELGDPPTPMLEDDDDVPLDHRQETEKERQRLAEAVKHHQINRNTVPEQPEGTPAHPQSSHHVAHLACRTPRSCQDEFESKSGGPRRRQLDV